MVWKSYRDTRKLQSQTSVNITNNWEESSKYLPKMKSTTYIVEITTQKNEKYLSEGRNPLACSPACLVSTEKFSPWVYWKVFCRFWPTKPRNLSHVVSVAPVFLGIFFYHSFYDITSRFYSNQGEGVHFYV